MMSQINIRPTPQKGQKGRKDRCHGSLEPAAATDWYKLLREFRAPVNSDPRGVFPWLTHVGAIASVRAPS